MVKALGCGVSKANLAGSSLDEIVTFFSGCFSSGCWWVRAKYTALGVGLLGSWDSGSGLFTGGWGFDMAENRTVRYQV